MEEPLVNAHVCRCKGGKTVNWRNVMAKLLIKLCVSAFVKIFVTKIIVDSIRR